MTKHTPGPWEVKRAKHPVDGAWDYAIGAEIEGAKYCVAEAYGRCAEDQYLPAEANACLIAAAPELLAALKTMRQWCRDHSIYPEGWDAGQDAIAKAEGAE